jgi:hypothetical protein
MESTLNPQPSTLEPSAFIRVHRRLPRSRPPAVTLCHPAWPLKRPIQRFGRQRIPGAGHVLDQSLHAQSVEPRNMHNPVMIRLHDVFAIIGNHEQVVLDAPARDDMSFDSTDQKGLLLGQVFDSPLESIRYGWSHCDDSAGGLKAIARWIETRPPATSSPNKTGAPRPKSGQKMRKELIELVSAAGCVPPPTFAWLGLKDEAFRGRVNRVQDDPQRCCLSKKFVSGKHFHFCSQ